MSFPSGLEVRGVPTTVFPLKFLLVSLAKVFLVLLFGGFLGSCIAHLPGPGVEADSFPDNPLRRPSMGMTPTELIQLWSETPCQIDTLYHGHPAEAWGFFYGELGTIWPPKATACEKANYWVYFENKQLIGWTPPP